MNRFLVSLFVLICAVVVASAQSFNFPPRLTQEFAIGDENYLIWWGGAALQGARSDDDGSTQVTARKLAIIATSFFDIVNAFEGQQQYNSYRPDPNTGAPYVAPAGGNVLAAIAGAGYELFTNLYEEQLLDWQVIYKTQIDLLRRGPLAPPPSAVSAGFNFGRDVAADRMRQFANDGSDAPDTWIPPPPGDGVWRLVAPFTSLPTNSHFANATTWVIPSPSSFRPEGPAFNFPEIFINNYREIINKGRDQSLGGGRRTVLETWTATFFSVELPGLQSLPGLYYDIALDIATDNHLSLLDTSRLLALTALALVDASYVVADAKFFFNDWRPVTAIHDLSVAGSERLDLQVEPDWEPLLQTPPCPDYLSETATLASAAGNIWRRFLNADNFDFYVTTDALPGVSATYFSFSQFIDDAAYSRVFSGSSWRKSGDDGVETGRRLANYIFINSLTPTS